MFENNRVDAFIYDVAAFNFKLETSAQTNNFVLASMLSEVVIFPENNPIADYLVSKARRIADGPAAVMPPAIAAMTSQFINNAMTDIRTSKDTTEIVFTAIDLVKALNELLLIRCNQGGSTRKNAARSLKKFYPQYFSAIGDAFSFLLRLENPEKLLAIAEEILSELPDSNEFSRIEIPIFGRTAITL